MATWGNVLGAGISAVKGEKRIGAEGIVNTKSYIFDNYASYADAVAPKIQEIVAKKHLPVKASMENFKNTGAGPSNVSLLMIDGNFNLKIAVSAIPYGDYLAVDVYTFAEGNFLNTLSAAIGKTTISDAALYGEDVISIRNQKAFLNAALSAVEEAFAALNFKETQHGFLGIK